MKVPAFGYGVYYLGTSESSYVLCLPAYEVGVFSGVLFPR